MSLRIFIANRINEPIVLALEPWGREIRMPPGFRVEVIFSGPSGVEVEHEDHRVVLYGWAESTVVAFHDGEEI
jgi:hypothetical protein